MSTFTQAIKNGNFVTWPGIGSLNFSKLLGTIMATAKGHLDGERKNLQTTQQTNIQNDEFPAKNTVRTNNQFATISDVKGFVAHTEKKYMDLTGGFPYMIQMQLSLNPLKQD